MSHRATEILNRWVAETVRPVPPQERAREAARLAVEFSAYATDAGLHLDLLEEDIGEDLTSYMRDALLAAADAEAEGPIADED
jgi:hypothetical protein